MTPSVLPELLRKLNERRVIETLQFHGPSTRADMTRIAGISAPTVSKAVASLLEAGLLEEMAAKQTASGRPGRLLRLACDRACVIGVVIDARQCWIGPASLDGQIDKQRSCEFSTPSTYRGLISAIVKRATPLFSEGVEVLGIGLSMPGLINHRQEKTVLSPNLHLTDGHWAARDLTDRLGSECVILQESHALCLGERFYGNAKGLDNFAVLDVSTGLGLGVMSGGRLLTGHSGLSGELGHITVDVPGKLCGCGNYGCLETVATDSAFAATVSKTLGRQLDIAEVVQSIRSGELKPTQPLEQTCEYLSIALAAIINIFNPATLIVHGQIFDAEEGLFATIVDKTRRRALGPSFDDCRIVRAIGSKRQGAVAGIIYHLTDSLAPDFT